jgi:hypothetical protein
MGGLRHTTVCQPLSGQETMIEHLNPPPLTLIATIAGLFMRLPGRHARRTLWVAWVYFLQAVGRRRKRLDRKTHT